MRKVKWVPGPESSGCVSGFHLGHNDGLMTDLGLLLGDLLNGLDLIELGVATPGLTRNGKVLRLSHRRLPGECVDSRSRLNGNHNFIRVLQRINHGLAVPRFSFLFLRPTRLSLFNHHRSGRGQERIVTRGQQLAECPSERCARS